MLVLFIFVAIVAMSYAVCYVLLDDVFLLFGRPLLAILVVLPQVIVPFFKYFKVLIEEAIFLGQFTISSFQQRVLSLLLFETILDFRHVMVDVLAFV